METLYTYQRIYHDVPKADAIAKLVRFRDHSSRRAMFNTAMRDTLKNFDGKVFNKRICTAIQTEITVRSGLGTIVNYEAYMPNHWRVKINGWEKSSSYVEYLNVIVTNDNRYDHAATETFNAPIYTSTEEAVQLYQNMIDNIDHELGCYRKTVDNARQALGQLGHFASVIN